MRKYVHNQTHERLSWQELKKRLHASIPYGTQTVGDWELEPMPEPVAVEPTEPQVTLEERVADLEDAVVELAGIIAGGE